LFIGVAVAPSITQRVVTASQEDDLVEVTTQACGIQGYKDTKVKLTKQQYQDLEQYLVEFRARLNQTSTREEAIPIFKDAVVELDKYGLLPKGMSVERAQQLVLGNNLQNCINRLLGNEQIRCLFPNFKNVFCLLFTYMKPGENHDDFLLNPLFILSGMIIGLLVRLNILTYWAFLFTFYFLAIGFFSPLKFMQLCAFSGYNDIFLISLGLNGLVTDGGNRLRMLGFSGIGLMNFDNDNKVFLGFCFALY
jgi:hypothetical protein